MGAEGDEALEESANLPEPDVIAAEIVEDLRAALEQFEELGEILSELRRRPNEIYGSRLRALYVYGSYARGEASADSDLDVLVVLDRVGSYWEERRR